MRLDDARSDNTVLTEKLVEHAEALRKQSLSEQQRATLIDDFFSHLKGVPRQNDNFPLIGHFILAMEKDFAAKERLELARQGLIIVDGLRYSAETSSEKLPRDLNIYLDTEILFSAVGYHGSLRQQLFKDFHTLVGELNKKAEKSSSGKVLLRYFDATYREVLNYFEAARLIVDKGGRPEPGKQAMTTIVNGCANGTHVLGKQALFKQELTRLKITPDNARDFYDPPNFNVESADLIKVLKVELSADEERIHQALQQFTRINYLRRGDSKTHLEAVGHIFLSDKSVVRAAAFSQGLGHMQPGVVSFSTDLDYMTERLWLKLNKGFNSGSIPTSFDVVARTRLVLSAQLGSKVSDEYQLLQRQQKDARTRMDQETLGYVVADLMNKMKRPEDVTGENLDVEFLASDDFVSNAVAEHATLMAEAEAGRKAKEDLQLAVDHIAEEREKTRLKMIAYEAEREDRERAHKNQELRFKRRETNLPILRRAQRVSKSVMAIYWCVPILVMSAIINFLRASADSDLSLFGMYWTILPVQYAIQGFFWKPVKRFIKSSVRRYVASRFRSSSKKGSVAAFGQ
jgi:hypothetical protein